ncbi:hypothetical protein ACFYE2_00580 [Kocuria sp. CPCC 205300]|uniref:hypothetical protein n=1 Tax=Kocuria sabuli TaxID=3071448 RepID=UPI0036DCA719
MNVTEARAFLTWANQHDPRVEPSPVNAEIWAHALGPYYPEQVKQAALEFFRTAGDKKINPADTRRFIQSMRTSEEARQSALEPPAKVINSPGAYRARNPELWDELREQGRREHLEQLKRAGAIK